MKRNWIKEAKQAIHWLFLFTIFCLMVICAGVLLITVPGVTGGLALIAPPLIGFGGIGFIFSCLATPFAVGIGLWKYDQLGKKIVREALGSFVFTYLVVGAFFVFNWKTFAP